jgi:hypothetical protein
MEESLIREVTRKLKLAEEAIDNYFPRVNGRVPQELYDEMWKIRHRLKELEHDIPHLRRRLELVERDLAAGDETAGEEKRRILDSIGRRRRGEALLPADQWEFIDYVRPSVFEGNLIPLRPQTPPQVRRRRKVSNISQLAVPHHVFQEAEDLTVAAYKKEWDEEIQPQFDAIREKVERERAIVMAARKMHESLNK